MLQLKFALLNSVSFKFTFLLWQVATGSQSEIKEEEWKKKKTNRSITEPQVIINIYSEFLNVQRILCKLKSRFVQKSCAKTFENGIYTPFYRSFKRLIFMFFFYFIVVFSENFMQWNKQEFNVHGWLNNYLE